MNFNSVRQAEGKKDEKGYQIKIAMFGTPDGIDDVAFTPEGKRFQQVTMTDDNGETNKVKIYLGTDKTMIDGCIGKRLAFNVAPNSFKNKMYYGGFWNDRAAIRPANTAANTPQSPQGASKPAAPTQTGEKYTVNIAKETDWDAKDLRMAKECALKCAVQKQVIMAEIAKDLNRVTDNKIIEVSEKFLDWIYAEPETELEKEAGDLLNEDADEPSPDDSDLPANVASYSPPDDAIPF